MNLSKKSKLAIAILLFTAAVGVVFYEYVMKPPATIEDREVAMTSEATAIFEKVKSNPSEWQDKVVVISGTVTSTDAAGLTLNENTYCQFKSNTEIPTTKLKVTLKGRIIGYDDLLEELKLDQCIIVN
jgi:hypothetical protein